MTTLKEYSFFENWFMLSIFRNLHSQSVDDLQEYSQEYFAPISAKKNTSFFSALISIQFEFDDNTILKYCDYINWDYFIKYNRVSKISYDLRLVLFEKYIGRYYKYENRLLLKSPLFHFNMIKATHSNFTRLFRDSTFLTHSVSLLTKQLPENLQNNTDLYAKDWEDISSWFDAFECIFTATDNYFEKHVSDISKLEISDFFWPLISTRIYLFSDDFLEKYESKLIWNDLTKNKGFKITIERLTKYEQKIVWKTLSSRNDDFWDDFILETFIGKWDWDLLSMNESVKWDLQRVTKFENFINWELISMNNNVEFSFDLLDKYKDKFSWRGYWEDTDYGEYYSGGISANSGIEWSEEFLERYRDLLDWEYISNYNLKIRWTKDLIRKFNDKISWSMLLNENTNKLDASTSDDLSQLVKMFNHTGSYSKLGGLNIDDRIIQEYLPVISADTILSNRVIDWNFNFFYQLILYRDYFTFSDMTLDVARRYHLLQEGGKLDFSILSNVVDKQSFAFPEIKLKYSKHTYQKLILNPSIRKKIFKRFLTIKNIDSIFNPS
jgi:hypothetical protein